MNLPVSVKIAGIVGVAGVLWFGNQVYIVGPAVDSANAKWSEKWKERDKADLLVRQQFSDEQRQKERSWQQTFDQKQREADAQIDKERRNAVASRAAADRLQSGIQDAIASLQQGRSLVAGTTTSSKTAASTGVLLAELYRSIDQRAGDLAEEADRRGKAGLTCEAAYDSIKKAR